MKIKAPQRIAFLFLVLILSGPGAWSQEEIPFVPTPIEVVDRMLELAQVTREDVVYDLGSGDGRIVIRAAKKYGARGVGIEMDVQLLELSRKSASEEGVAHLVEFRAEDALAADVSPATVVTLYMLPWFNEKVKPLLEEKLKPGARVIAHDFAIHGWRPARIEKFPKPERKKGGLVHWHVLYLYLINDQ